MKIPEDVFMNLPLPVKFAIAIGYDLGDLVSIPGFGTAYDIAGIPLGYALWGPVGLANAWEVLDPLDVTDRVIPTMTMTGLASLDIWSRFK